MTANLVTGVVCWTLCGLRGSGGQHWVYLDSRGNNSRGCGGAGGDSDDGLARGCFQCGEDRGFGRRCGEVSYNIQDMHTPTSSERVRGGRVSVALLGLLLSHA